MGPRVQPPRVDTIRSVEASLRLDAIASAGFRLSRGKLQELIDGGDLRVNWRPAAKGSATLKAGDVVTVRGKGRLVLGSVEVSKKEKFIVEIQRFL